MKKVIVFSKHGIRALLPLIAGYMLFRLAFEAFGKISFAVYPANDFLNVLVNIVIWFFLTTAVGAFIGIPAIRRSALQWADISPRLYLILKFFLGNDEEQDVKYQEVLFELFPRKWKIGILMGNAAARIKETETELCVVMEPSTPVPFTGALHIIPKSDLIFTGRTIDKTVLTILSLGTKFEINPDLELVQKKEKTKIAARKSKRRQN